MIEVNLYVRDPLSMVNFTPGGKWDRYLRGKGHVDELGSGEQDRSVKNVAYRLVS